jgi:hypothetical protein
MMPQPTRIAEVPPGALVATETGPRRFWFIPPDTVITAAPNGGDIAQGIVPGDAPNHIVMMFVPTEAEALATLVIAFNGQVEIINQPVSE